MSFRVPLDFEFSESLREDYKKRHWEMPVHLVKSGRLAQLWRESGRRSGGVATSMLPVLAIETWLGKAHNRAEIDAALGLAPRSANWTPWASASHRRIARVSGIALSSVTVGFGILARQGLCEFATVRCETALGRRRTYYRMSKALYPAAGERFALMSGSLLYGGHWMVLPTNAARHLMLTLLTLDPVFDAESMEDSIGEDLVLERREKYAVSWAKLERYSGLSRSTLIESLGVLTSQVDDYKPYFERGGESPYWYARTDLTWYWNADFLNDGRKHFDATRARQWPEVAHRVAQDKRRRTLTRRRRQKNAAAA